MLNEELNDQSCPNPKCKAVGALKRETIGKATLIGRDLVKQHPYAESEKLPVEGIICGKCGSIAEYVNTLQP